MVSLTSPHVLPLKDALKILCKSAGVLMRSPRLCGVVGGYIRTVEITQGRNGWHPHIHILARVEDSYFRSALYVHESEWADLWMAALEKADKKIYKTLETYLDNINLSAPVIDVRAVVDGGGAAAGCLKTAHEENLDLIHESETGSAELCPICGAWLQLVDWIFSGGEYSPAPAPLNWWEKRRRE